MNKIIFACVLLAACGGRDVFNDVDASEPACDLVVCDGLDPNMPDDPLDLSDGGTDAPDGEDLDPDAETPLEDAGDDADSAVEPGEDASVPDGAVPGSLTAESLPGTWSVYTASLKMCSLFELVDGAGTYYEDEGFHIAADLTVVQAASCETCAETAFTFVSFEDGMLRAEAINTAADRKRTLEITFGDVDTFEGTITTTTIAGEGICNGAPVQGLRGTRTP